MMERWLIGGSIDPQQMRDRDEVVAPIATKTYFSRFS